MLREKDRRLADLFHILPVQELSGDDNLRVLIGTQRQLEARHRCRFAIESLPIVIDLQRRYARDTAFPGKGAAFLRRLAVKVENSEEPISRDRVITAFHEQTGLPRSLLDQRETLAVDDVRRALRERFVGQPDAVQAAVEIIGLAKSRLNDPDRPIASLLLLGPTGVEKTQFAKSVAAYLFGADDRLLRFDMNEYVSPNAVPQLVGTFGQPEGLLTSAVRRQPFAVVLFDEIEKAHPEVFDVLMNVFDEGRLTDRFGRATIFRSAVIVLTSNLGATSSGSVGFGERDDTSRLLASSFGRSSSIVWTQSSALTRCPNRRSRRSRKRNCARSPFVKDCGSTTYNCHGRARLSLDWRRPASILDTALGRCSERSKRTS